MSETNVKIENNFHFTGNDQREEGVAANVVNNFYFYNGTTASGGQPDLMTKDTSITDPKPDQMTKDTSITDTKPVRMTKDTSITDTKPVRMTSDMSIPRSEDLIKKNLIEDLDEMWAAMREDEGKESGNEIVNNFYFKGGSRDSQSVSVSNNFYFGGDDDHPLGMTKDTSITSRAVQPAQGSDDPAELPDVPNVDHQHIK